jgi:tetratricopeptide (TPR) repeat protein
MEPINWRQYYYFLTQAFCTGSEGVTDSHSNGHTNGHTNGSRLRRLSPATASRLLELLLERKYRRYLERCPDDVEARVRLAFLLYFRGISDEVEQHCRRALELAPNFAPAYLVLGLEYRARQEWQRAREMFQRALELAPSMSAARQFLQELTAEQVERGAVAARPHVLVR